MRRIILAVGVALGVSGLAAPAAGQDSVEISTADSGNGATIVPRARIRGAEAAATTRTGHAAIVLKGQHVVLQLTDQGLRDIKRDIKREATDGLGSAIIHAMLGAGVVELLDHGVAYPVDSLGAARYERGELILEDRQGNRVFKDTEVDGEMVMRSFREDEARRFARAVREKMRGR